MQKSLVMAHKLPRRRRNEFVQGTEEAGPQLSQASAAACELLDTLHTLQRELVAQSSCFDVRGSAVWCVAVWCLVARGGQGFTFVGNVRTWILAMRSKTMTQLSITGAKFRARGPRWSLPWWILFLSGSADSWYEARVLA